MQIIQIFFQNRLFLTDESIKTEMEVEMNSRKQVILFMHI